MLREHAADDGGDGDMSRKFPKYPTYKDSGVEWLGKVPEHWEVIAIKWLSPVQRGASPRPIDDQKYFDEEGEYAWVRIADISASDGRLVETTQRLSDLGSSLSVKLQPGQLFISIAGTVGKPCITDIKCCIHDGFVYFPSLEIDPMFLFRLFESGSCYGGLGKLGTQLNLNTDTIGSIRIGLPPSNEMDDILRYLDQQTSRLDGLISEQRRLIDLLREKRSALISHAVTKGLDPNVPMKDSGVEWLGMVPEHWEVVPLKCLVTTNDDVLTDKSDPNKEIEYVDIGSVSIEHGIERTEFLVFADAPSRARRLVKDGDIIISTVRTYLKAIAAIHNASPNLVVSTGFAVIRPKECLLSEFAKHGLQANYFMDDVITRSVGVSYPAINTSDMVSIKVATPPLEEQSAIATYLDQQTSRMDSLITEAERSISFMQERRSALITAAVTGKIDVRELVEA